MATVFVCVCVSMYVCVCVCVCVFVCFKSLTRATEPQGNYHHPRCVRATKIRPPSHILHSHTTPFESFISFKGTTLSFRGSYLYMSYTNNILMLILSCKAFGVVFLFETAVVIEYTLSNFSFQPPPVNQGCQNLWLVCTCTEFTSTAEIYMPPIILFCEANVLQKIMDLVEIYFLFYRYKNSFICPE